MSSIPLRRGACRIVRTTACMRILETLASTNARRCITAAGSLMLPIKLSVFRKLQLNVGRSVAHAGDHSKAHVRTVVDHHSML